MKKIIAGAALFAALTMSQAAYAGVNVNVGISLPPIFTFQAPPSVVVMPEAPDVYVVPDVAVDIFFWNGWWWRHANGSWFRSHDYNNGWAAYNSTPQFYHKVNRHWRDNYNNGRWGNSQWNHQAIPYDNLQHNWKSWKQNKHWQNNPQWGNGNGNGNSRPQVIQQNNYYYQQAPQKNQGNGHGNGKGNKWQNQQNGNYQQGGNYQQNGNYRQNNQQDDPAKHLFK